MTWKAFPLPDETQTLLHEIKGAALTVHREIGAGFREHVHPRYLVS